MYRNQERWSIRELKEIQQQQQHWRQQRQSNKSKSEWREIKKKVTVEKIQNVTLKKANRLFHVYEDGAEGKIAFIWYYLIGVAAAQAKRKRENEYFDEN